MATHSVVENIPLQYKGFYDFDKLYQLVRTWLLRHDYHVDENLYKDKPDTHFGNEVEIKLSGWRNETPFIKYWVNVYIHIRDNIQVDLVVNGQKKPSNKGRVEILLSGKLEYDWQKKFQGKLAPYFLQLLWKKILEWEWKTKHGRKLYYQLYSFSDDLKKFLNMHTDKGAY